MENPFTPASIVSLPGDFFGRAEELAALSRSICQGSHVAVNGPVGIGKSSLVARLRLDLEGFCSTDRADSVVAVGHRDIKTVDDAAKLLLCRFVDIDEESAVFNVGFSKGIEFKFESSTLRRYFNDGRHLDVLQDVLLKRAPEHTDLLLLIVDEADKCPIPLARLFRVMVTQLQHEEVRNIRFVFAGVGSYLKEMTSEDPGIGRFLARPMTVLPMSLDEATELVETKLRLLANPTESDEADKVEVHPQVVDRIVSLSGGHPHLIQFLGYHLVEQEWTDPDGRLDTRDLANTFRKICYEDRAYVYDPLFSRLQMEGMYEPLRALLDVGSRTPPTNISQESASLACGPDALEWLCSNCVLMQTAEGFQLIDEFVRIRMIIEEQAEIQSLETRLLKYGAYATDPEAFRDQFFDDPENPEWLGT